MFKKLIAILVAGFVCAGSAHAQQTTVKIAVDELSSAESLVSFRKLVSEYLVTELAACNLVKVVGYDAVNNAKAALKIDTAKGDVKTLDALVKKLQVDVLCFGKTVRKDDGAVSVEIQVFKDGVVQEKKASVTLKSIEDSDDAAKLLAAQIESIVRGSEIKAEDDVTSKADDKKAPAAGEKVDADTPAAKPAEGCCGAAK